MSELQLQGKEFSVTLGGQSYAVVIGLNPEVSLVSLIKNATRVAVISDNSVANTWGRELTRTLEDKYKFKVGLFSFPAGEKSKTQKTVTEIQNQLLEKKYGRDTLVIALGGGVVGDVAGYVAATFMRGVPYIQIPTTILAMVDSSIGGKVGVDTEYGKNTIGAFWHPRGVIDDLRYIESLPKTEIVSGILEAVKMFLTSDKETLKYVDALDLENPLRTQDELLEVVYRAASLKAEVVQRDEREENERRILNFGHTIGHAIELLSNYAMPHGFAVGHGILVETRISELLGILAKDECSKVHAYLERFGITAKGLKEFDVAAVIEATKGDKKVRGGSVYYVLLESIGSVYKKDGQYAHPVEDAVVQKAYESLIRP